MYAYAHHVAKRQANVYLIQSCSIPFTEVPDLKPGIAWYLRAGGALNYWLSAMRPGQESSQRGGQVKWNWAQEMSGSIERV